MMKQRSSHLLERAELTRLTDAGREFCRLRSFTQEELTMKAEDPARSLVERLAAGKLLGLLGDARVRTPPSVYAVEGGTVRVGLAESQVEEVAGRWEHVGLDRSWLIKEVPQHEVELADFWIATYPVTNWQFYQFLLETGWPERPSTWYLGAYPWDRANHPVAGTSARSADRYAMWLSSETEHPWRLPSEAEWEYAAKGPDGWEYPWGETFDNGCANTREAGVHTTTPVGVFPAGRAYCGAMDMAGNVEEYVADDYAPYPGGRVVDDHLLRRLGTYRVTRGGSFARFGDLARTRRRHGPLPSPLYPAGFRVATSTDPIGNVADES